MDLACALMIAGMMVFASPAYADPDNDESGKGRRGERYSTQDRFRYDDERIEKFRTADGCKVERKWKRGEYEERLNASDVIATEVRSKSQRPVLLPSRPEIGVLKPNC